MIDKEIIASISLVVALIIQQYFNRRKGKNDSTHIERESFKLARQTSETVNRCSEKTNKFMERNDEIMEEVKRYMEKNDIRYLSTSLKDAVQLLAKMAEHQSDCIRTLDRVASLVHSIADDLQKTDSRIVHASIENKIKIVEGLVEDIKRIVINKR